MKQYIFIKLSLCFSVFVLFYFLLNYNSSSRTKCDNFINSFNSWFQDNHPIEIGNYSVYDNFVNIKRNDYIDINEYLSDLNRFNIEVSQINKNKIDKVSIEKIEEIEFVVEKLILRFDIGNSFKTNISEHTSTIFAVLFENFFIKSDEFNNSHNTHTSIQSIIHYTKKLNEIFDFNKDNNNIKAIYDIRNIQILISEFELYIDVNDQVYNDINELKLNLSELLENIDSDVEINCDFYNLYTDYYFKDINQYLNTIESMKAEQKKLKKEVFNLIVEEFLNDKNILNLNNHLLWEDFNKDDTLLVEELGLTNNLFLSDSIEAINYVIDKKTSYLNKDFDSNVIAFENSIDTINSIFNNQLSSTFKFISIDELDFFVPENILILNKKLQTSDEFLIYYDDSQSNTFLSTSIINNFIIENLLFYHNLNSNCNSKLYYLDKDKFYGWRKVLSRISLLNGINEYDKNYYFLSRLNLLRDLTNIIAAHKLKFLKEDISKDELVDYLYLNAYYSADYLSEELLANTIYSSDYYLLDDYRYFMELNKRFDDECVLSDKTSYDEFIFKMINDY